MPTTKEINIFLNGRYEMLQHARENKLETLERVVRKNISDFEKLIPKSENKQLKLF